MKLAIAVALLCALFLMEPVEANTFCLTVNRVATTQGLQSYSDEQVENETCMVSREAVEAIGRSDSSGQTACFEATRHMLTEFMRRFPGRDPKGTVGRC
jgi:hypothetical protein